MSEPAHPGTAARSASLARGGVAALSLALAAWAAADYPLAPGWLAAGLVLYAALLWRWPAAWLVVVPAALPSLDLAPWTGWSMVEEPDLVVLVTIGVLALRAPPRRGEFGFSGIAGAALALVILCGVIGAARGLVLPGLPEGSAIAELRPDNALRVAKGLALALALLPFLRRALAERANATRLFGAGMAAGLALVAIAALRERLLFPGILNFEDDYRIVATFSSMHFGGGYVGVYAAMALPFALAPLGRLSWRATAPLAMVAAAGLYTLTVTFARAAYASATVGCVVLLAGSIHAGRRRRLPLRSLAAPLMFLAASVGAIVWAATGSDFMQSRIDLAMPDLAWRTSLWTRGLALRPGDMGTQIFGMGLGSYARADFAALPLRNGPGNLAVRTGSETRYVAIEAGQPLYLVQRVPILPGRTYRLSLDFRARQAGAELVAELCENAMLYSARCSDIDVEPQTPGAWEQVDGTIASGGIARKVRLGVLRRPTWLAIYLPRPGTAADIADIRLADEGGRELVANGDFAQGIARWFMVDDEHTQWRIENQYLMTLFEEGALGVLALLIFAAVALGRAVKALPRGDPMAPAFAAALAAFLASCLFDCPLEVPRLAALFYLTAFTAMALGESRTSDVASSSRA